MGAARINLWAYDLNRLKNNKLQQKMYFLKFLFKIRCQNPCFFLMEKVVISNLGNLFVRLFFVMGLVIKIM